MIRRRHVPEWLTAAALLLGVAAGGTAWAQGAPGSPPQAPRRQQLLTPEDRAAMRQIYWHRLQERLGLSDQQVTDIQTVLQNRQSASRADVQALFAARRQMRTLLEQPSTDPAAIQTAAAQVKSLQDKLFDQRLQTRLDIRSKLTPEQLAKWVQLRQGMGHRPWQRGRGFAGGAL